MLFTEDAKEKIYIDFHDKVLGYLSAKLSSRMDAEDLCADVFVKVYAKLDTFDEAKASLSTWIFHITRNTLFDFFRRTRPTEELDEALPAEGDFTDDICRKEALNALADALEQLEERDRDIILLHYYQGRTLKDIADTLDYSYSYIKFLHNRAVSTLKEKLHSSGFSVDSFV